MFDLVIRNGLIADGSGTTPYRAALYVQGERIVKIDTDETLPAKEAVDAKGHMVSPGFIDMHTHSDTVPWTAPGFEGRLHQGVTTDIAGNCGTSAIPKKEPSNPKMHCRNMAEMKEELKDMAFGANFNTFIGHGTLRNYCMADPYAQIPTAEEMEAMKAALRKELEAGAIGMSIGLIYMPGTCCETEELIELAKVVAEYDGVVSVHMRDESHKVFEAMDEVHRIARESGAHLHISHFKVTRKPQWGKAGQALAKVDEMQKDSFITVDQYPWTASSTGIRCMLPTWAKKGTPEEMTARLDVPEYWEEIKKHVEYCIDDYGDVDRICVSVTGGKWPEIEGKNLGEIAEMLGTTPAEAYRIAMKCCNSTISGVLHTMSRDDVLTILKREDIALISDSGSQDFVTGKAIGKPHPRSTSSDAKFLRLVREEKLMPIEKAIAKMTSVPAKYAGLKERGLLKEGYYADIVIFDPETVAERGSYENPHQTAVGIDKVFVNGVLAWEDGMPVKMAGKLAERK